VGGVCEGAVRREVIALPEFGADAYISVVRPEGAPALSEEEREAFVDVARAGVRFLERKARES